MISRLWFDLPYRRAVHRAVNELGEWYQQICLPGLIFTRPWNAETLGQWCNAERGPRKLRRFIKPDLPDGLCGKTVLEVGCNSAANLLWAVRQGAAVGFGIEADPRYYAQAQLVRQVLGERRYTVVHRDIVTMRLTKVYGVSWTYGWLLNVLYHIPAADRVPVLRKVAGVCRYLILQGNGIGDEPDGRGYTSLMEYVHEAGLSVVSIRRDHHVRGLTILARAG